MSLACQDDITNIAIIIFAVEDSVGTCLYGKAVLTVKVYAVEDREPDELLRPRFGHVHDHGRRVGEAIGDIGRRAQIYKGTRRRFIPKGGELVEVGFFRHI